MLRDRRGFTIIELVVVISIIGVLLGSVWAYTYVSDLERGRVAATAERIKVIRDGVVRYMDENCFDFACVTQSALGTGDPIYVPSQVWTHSWGGAIALTTTPTTFTIDLQDLGAATQQAVAAKYQGVAYSVAQYATGVLITFQ